ncbi:unnamed protein product [Bathycoccus prasinos]
MSSSSFLLKKVDVSYARVAAALVVLLPSSAFCLRLYKDSVAEDPMEEALRRRAAASSPPPFAK